MLLRALTDIPSSCTAIRKGDQFREPDTERAQEWIRMGCAEPWAQVRMVEGVAKTTNSRGWDKLWWDGCTVCIIASGPSVTPEQCASVKAWRDADPTRKVIVINTTFRLAPWADLLYACDARWWQCEDPATGMTYYEEAAQHFKPEQLWSTDAAAGAVYGVNIVANAREDGLSKRPGLINTGNNSGYQACGLAYHAGAVRLILLGFDMKKVAGKDHHFGDHPAKLRSTNPYTTWVQKFNTLAPDLKAAGVTVINCTPGSALKCFNTASLENTLNPEALHRMYESARA